MMNGIAQARGNREYPVGKAEETVVHNEVEVPLDIKIVTRLPRRLGDGNVLSLVAVDTGAFFGKAISIQRTNGVLTPDDWQEPRLSSEDWVVVEDCLISYKYCLKINSSKCLYSLLEKYFRQYNLDHYGWEKLKNDQGDVIALIIRDFSQNGR